MWSNRWKKGVDYPEWADAEVYKKPRDDATS